MTKPIRCMYFAFAIIFILSGTISIANAKEPPLQQFVVNNQTKQCGVYYPDRDLPNNLTLLDWEKAEIVSNGLVKTPQGECNSIDGYQNCCEKLGWEFLDTNDIPYSKKLISYSGVEGWKCVPYNDPSRFGLMVNYKTEQCSPYTDYLLVNGNRVLNDVQHLCDPSGTEWDDLESYFLYSNEETFIETPYGNCSDVDPERCCEELGFDYIGWVNEGADKYPPIIKYIGIGFLFFSLGFVASYLLSKYRRR